MTTNEDKSKAFRQVVKKSEYARMMNKNNNFLVCNIQLIYYSEYNLL